jgi:glyoxylase-like metal-dependent hydrolase (beta-lactamase superfamily II)
MPIPLEDNLSDIVGKAQRGLKISDSQLSERAGVSLREIREIRDGGFNAVTVAKIAPVLRLNAEALADSGRKAWRPEPVEPVDGLVAFNTPFNDMTVNSYLLWDPETGRAAAFDTGSDSDGMLDFLERNRLRLDAIFLTHTHGDHIYDLDRLKARTGATAFVSKRERIEGAHPFEEGRRFEIGGLRIETRLTRGHSEGGTTYVVTGLAKTLAVAGDAMFAGSMGGGMVSYEDALRTNREKILSLPDDTVLCPGHGPMSTVGEEKRHNPFFA